MFTIKRSTNKALSQNRQSKSTSSPSLGISSKNKISPDEDPNISTSNFVSTSYSMPTSMGPSSNLSSNAVTIDMEPLLTGLTPQVESAFYRLYRDIYYFDSVAGSAVDLISQVTYSGEFSIGGISNDKISRVYEEVIERLNTRTLLPEMSTDYLVLGVHCSSLLYNKKKKQFADMMCHPVESLTVTDIPFYSQDPIINVRFNDSVKKAISGNTQTANNLRELVGDTILDKIKSGSLDLDPLTTIYIPRKTFSYTEHGTSYFKRILPLYLIEKNLFRGTLVESARRQRGILHLTLGDGEEWIPQVSDMEFMTELFMNADSDPLGAIVATRSGVQVEEVRQGGDFWKVTDFSDSVLPYKLRALGISEAFLSGDANYNTADASLTIFVEMLRSYRDMLTRKFFYERIFPLVSMANGYVVDSKGKISIRDTLKDSDSMSDALSRMNDGSKLLIPSVIWAKQLKPEGDSTYLEMLNTMSEKGVPVPLRVLAAAGGLNLDELLRQKDDDLAARRQMQEYTKAVAKISPPPSDGEAEASASLSNSGLLLRSKTGNSAVLQSTNGRRPSLLSREFDSELKDVSKTGKPKSMSAGAQKQKNEKIDRLIVRAMKDNNLTRRVRVTPAREDGTKTSF